MRICAKPSIPPAGYLLTGKERLFCAGGDVQLLAGAASDGQTCCGVNVAYLARPLGHSNAGMLLDHYGRSIEDGEAVYKVKS